MDSRLSPQGQGAPTTAWVALLVAALPLALLPWLVESGSGMTRGSAVAHLLRLRAEGHLPAGVSLTAPVLGPGGVLPWLLYGLEVAVGQRLAERLLGAVAILALPLAQLRLLRRLAPEHWANAVLLLPLSAGATLLLGYTGFLLGYALALLAMAQVAAVERSSPLSRAGALALLLASALVDPLSALVGAAGVAALLSRHRSGVQRAVDLTLVMGPPLLWAVAWGGLLWQRAYLPLDRWAATVLVGERVTSAWAEIALRALPHLWLLIGAIVGVWRAHASGPAARLGLVAVAVLLLIPEGLRADGGSSSQAAFLVLTAAAALAPVPGPLARPLGATVAGLALTLPLVAWLSTSTRTAAAQQARVVEASRIVPAGSPVLPLVFQPGSSGLRTGPLLRTWSLLAVELDLVSPFVPGVHGLPPALGEWTAADFASIAPGSCFGNREPRMDCTCMPWRAVRLEALIQSAQAYPWLIAIGPPEDFQKRLETGWQVANRTGDVWVYQRTGPLERSTSPLLCEGAGR